MTDTSEHEPIYRLTDLQILELLAARQGRRRAKDALAKCREFCLLASHKDPRLEPGLVAAAGFIELFSEAVDPEGRLEAITAGRVKQIMTPLPATAAQSSPSIPAQAARALALDLAKPPRSPRPQTPARIAARANSNYKPTGSGKKGAITARIKQLEAKTFRLKDIQRESEESYMDVYEAVRTLIVNGYVRKISHGIYERTAE